MIMDVVIDHPLKDALMIDRVYEVHWQMIIAQCKSFAEFCYESFGPASLAVCPSTGGEWSDSSKFALCTIICHTFFPLGLMIMSGIAYFVRNWRLLQLVLFSPLVLVVALFYW